jgi:hypothetical protein
MFSVRIIPALGIPSYKLNKKRENRKENRKEKRKKERIQFYGKNFKRENINFFPYDGLYFLFWIQFDFIVR